MANENGTARLDRIERVLELLIADHEHFRDEHKRLLTAQVVLTDRMEKLTALVEKLGEKIEEVVESQKHTDQRLNALIGVVDGFIRRRPHE